jgi:hypothetical protein
MEVNWEKVKDEFEEEMKTKLHNLPGHREVSENLREFRNVISHELPETAPVEIFQHLIDVLLKEKQVDIDKIGREYLEPQIEIEKQTLEKHKSDFIRLKKSAAKWIKKSLSEKELKNLWKEHKTWLPRRYTIYKKQVSFQKISTDTLARFVLVKSKRYL